MKVYPFVPNLTCAACERPTIGWVDMSPGRPGVNDGFVLPCGHALLGERTLSDVDLALVILMMDNQ